MKSIQHTATLCYYDGIQIFEAQDLIGGHYIALLVDISDKGNQYLIVGVSPEQLRQFRSGQIDLRTIIAQRVDKYWYIVTIQGKITEKIELIKQLKKSIPLKYLPEKDFYLHGGVQEEISSTVMEARGRNNIILEITLEPPESAQGHRIRANTLSGLLAHFQNLVKHAFSKIVNDIPLNQRAIDYHLLDVIVPAKAGSFKIVLESSQPVDIFGYNYIANGLDKIDELMEQPSNIKFTVERVRQNKGHLAASFVRLLELLIKCKTGIQYSWAAPNYIQPKIRNICEKDAKPLINALLKVENLTVETVTLIGPLRKVDVDAGTWRLGGYGERKEEHSGKLKEGGPSLSHLETDKIYKFICEETIEEISGTGKETRILYLIDYEEFK